MKAGTVAGEGKAVTSCRSQSGEGCGEPGSIEPEARETELEGSGEAKRPALPIAMFSTVHAGGEQGWKSDHLEPFFFLGAFAFSFSSHSDYRARRCSTARWPDLCGDS